MAIDAMIDRFRATGCAYAIDGKQGGRLLSPLQQVDYRDFAANPQDWGTSWADAIGASDGWEVDITARYYALNSTNLVFGRTNGNFMVQTDKSLVLVAFYCMDTTSSPVWNVEPDYTTYVTTQIGSLSVVCRLAKTLFPAGAFHSLRLVRGVGQVSVYFDGELVATCTGTLIDNKPFNSLTNDGNIQSVTLKNSAGTTVWRASQSELYSGWMLKPLSQVPGGATFELKQGLIQYGDDTVRSDNAGNLVSSNENIVSRCIYIPIDLRGYDGDFSILWQGDNTSGNAIFAQGGPGAALVQVQFASPTATGNGYVHLGNGTVGVTTYIDKTIAPPGKIIFVLCVDRNASTVKVYANGNLAGTNIIPADFGALNPSTPGANMVVRLVDGLSRFAFWNKALSIEEVTAL